MSKQFLTDVSYPKGYTLTKIIPPRVGGRSFQGTSNLLAAVSREGQLLSLEIVGTGDGVSLMYRAAHDDTLFSTMMSAHFPSAIVEAVPSDADHLLVGPDEAAWTCTLKVEGQPYLPLRIFNNIDLQADHGADPMAALIGAHADMGGHERVVTRLILKPWLATGRSRTNVLGWAAQAPTTRRGALRNSGPNQALPSPPLVTVSQVWSAPSSGGSAGGSLTRSTIMSIRPWRSRESPTWPFSSRYRLPY